MVNSNEYQDHWITTFKGKKFHFLAPSLDEIDIRDIAHALSMTCRFAGHSRDFYSVAEHSLYVCDLVQQKHKLSALLHDAHEAYLHDLPRPIKFVFPQYKVLANNIQLVIDEKFGTYLIDEILNADSVMLATEARDLGIDTTDWMPLPPPIQGQILSLKHGIAEVVFLARFRELTEGKAVYAPCER